MKKSRLNLIAVCMALTLVFSCILTSCSSKSVSQESIQAYNKSEGLWYQYRLEEAKASLEGILKEDPGYSDANRKMAFIEYYYYQNYDKALEYIQKALDEQPGEAQNHTVAGDIYYAEGKYEMAAVNYENALKLDSKNPDIYFLLAQSFIKLNKGDEARRALEKGNGINPCDVRINTALHLKFIQNEEYGKAYDVWEKGNVSDTAPVGYFRDWNNLYRDTLDNNAADRHVQFGHLYAKLLRYDEAKLELERALKDDPDNSEISNKLNEISLFIKFRDELKECWYSYYNRRIINGNKEESGFKKEVERIYKQMFVLFPNVEYNSPDFNNWAAYRLNNEIQNKFNVIVNWWIEDGFLTGYFGYVVGDSYENISHWGKSLDISVTLSGNTIVNSLWSWYHKIEGLGGWSGTFRDENKELKFENKILLDLKYKNAYDLWEAATNKEKRDAMIAKAEETDKALIKKPSLEVFYSSLLSMQCSLKAIDQLIEKAKTKLSSEEEVKAYVINYLVYDVDVPLTYIHEGQHALDSKYHNCEKWELEYRAMMTEPVYGEIQLHNLTSKLHPDIGDESTAYGKAHTMIFTDIVNYINDHKKEYPAIDTNKNIMMQLSKLSSEDLKEISKNIYEQKYPWERYE